MPEQYYTLASCPESLDMLCPECSSRACYSGSSVPIRSLDGTKMIVIERYEKAPDAQIITQAETEALIHSPEWAEPDDE